MLVEAFGGWGIDITVADSASQGWEMILSDAKNSNPYTLIIIDQNLHDQDGEELGRLIKSTEETKSSHLVMMTSVGKRGDVARMEQVGFEGYLTKPIKNKTLYDCLVRVVSRSENVSRISTRIVTKYSVEESKKEEFNILVADDNPTNLLVAQKLLQRLGYHSETAENGTEVIEKLSVNEFDLLLLDIQMPGLDGYEVASIIRDPCSVVRCHEIPIVALTGHALKSHEEKCYESGMNDFLTKPIVPQLLFNAVEKWLFGEIRSSLQVVEKEGEDNDSSGGGSELPAFDDQALLERLDGDHEMVSHVLSIFLNDAPKQIEEMNEYVNAGDSEGVSKVAHRLKGACGNVGANSLFDYATTISSKAPEKDELRSIVEKFELLLESFKAEVLKKGFILDS